MHHNDPRVAECPQCFPPREAPDHAFAIWIADSNHLRARKNTGTESPPVHAKKKPGLSAGMRKRPGLRQASAMGAATGFSFWIEANAFRRDNLRWARGSAMTEAFSYAGRRGTIYIVYGLQALTDLEKAMPRSTAGTRALPNLVGIVAILF